MYITERTIMDDTRKRRLEKLGVREIEGISVGMRILKVIFNNPATIIIWSDGSKTVVKCQSGDEYDPQRGFLLCVAKRMFDNCGRYNDIMRYWMPWLED